VVLAWPRINARSILVALALLAIANGIPVAARKLLGNRFATRLDGGTRLPDGEPVFGESKTVRGAVLSIIGTALATALAGLGWATGAEFAAASMAGDLLSSFVKRRLGLEVHARFIGLDQIPEALLPMLASRSELRLSGLDIVIAVAAFIVLELALSRVLVRLHIRDRPW
jgi:hypothetical protein